MRSVALLIVSLSLALASTAFAYRCLVYGPARDALLDREHEQQVIRDETVRCGQAAERFYRSRGGIIGIKNVDGGEEMEGYQNHYDPRRRSCFIVLITTTIHAAAPTYTSQSYEILDVDEGATYGHFYAKAHSSPLICKVLHTSCSSFKEWQNMARPLVGSLVFKDF